VDLVRNVIEYRGTATRANLPIEEVGVWIAVTYATVIVFEILKLWQASGRTARHALLEEK